jgi:hypothetical protein
MSRPTCTDVRCERPVVRFRDDKGWCLYHPDAEAPDIDPLSGKLRNPEKATPLRKAAAKPKPAPYRAPGRVVVQAHPAPVEEAPVDGLCTKNPGCPRPWQHRGQHTKARPQAPADGLCGQPGCTRPWKHHGSHTRPFDIETASRRYLAGEGSERIATDLHVSPDRLRDELRAAGVEIRPQYAPAPRPSLPVQQAVQELVRMPSRQELQPRPEPAITGQLICRLDPDQTEAVHRWVAHLNQTVSDYLQSLILADLRCAGRLPSPDVDLLGAPATTPRRTST